MMTDEMVELEQRDFDRKVSMGLKALSTYRGFSLTQLAQLSGVAYPTISYVYNEYQEKGSSRTRHWTIPVLIKLAHALGVSLGELLSACLYCEDNSPEGMVIRSAVRDTEPHTPARLQCLIRAVRGFDERTGVDKVGESGITLTSHYAEMGSPKFCDAYYAGRLDDIEAAKIIAATFGELDPATNKPLLFAFALDKVVKNS